MKLNVLSDLHLSLGELPVPRNDAEVVILAGDIARPEQAAAWASGFAKPVLYVPGNHEFYGGTISGVAQELKRYFAGTHVHVMDNDEIVLEGVRFLGTTLWTDFLLLGEGDERAAAIREAQRMMRDFSGIRTAGAEQRCFAPADSAALFCANDAWLERKLAQPHACGYTGIPTTVSTMS